MWLLRLNQRWGGGCSRSQPICSLSTLYPFLPGSWECSQILLFHRRQFGNPKNQHTPFPKFQKTDVFLNRAMSPCHVNGTRFTGSRLSFYRSRVVILCANQTSNPIVRWTDLSFFSGSCPVHLIVSAWTVTGRKLRVGCFHFRFNYHLLNI